MNKIKMGRKLNVLSLFDGMSGGQIALNQLGFEYNYYASEVEQKPIEVTQHNFPNTIQLGSVTDINYFDGKLHTNNGVFETNIDIIIGGSPCQSFSFAGEMNGMSTESGVEILDLEHYLKLKNNGFKFKGQSYLFWEYIRLLKEIQPKYFFLENVEMPKKWQNVIDEVLGVKPYSINSNIMTAQNRVRNYWTNIFFNKYELLKLDYNINDILEHNVPMKYNFYRDGLNEFMLNIEQNTTPTKNGIVKVFDIPKEIYKDNERQRRVYSVYGKSPTLLARADTTKIFIEPNIIRKLTPLECERLQGIPDNYSDCVSDTHRYKMVGNGWSIPIIKMFFSNIKIN